MSGPQDELRLPPSPDSAPAGPVNRIRLPNGDVVEEPADVDVLGGLSRELHNLCQTFGYGWDRLQWFAVNAMKSAFIGFDERLALINDVIKPGYAALQA